MGYSSFIPPPAGHSPKVHCSTILASYALPHREVYFLVTAKNDCLTSESIGCPVVDMSLKERLTKTPLPDLVCLVASSEQEALTLADRINSLSQQNIGIASYISDTDYFSGDAFLLFGNAQLAFLRACEVGEKYLFYNV